MDGNRTLGTHFEGVAARYLRSKGVKLLDRNVYNRGGEIDLIGHLVDPASSINHTKQQRLVRAASFYLHRHGLWDRLARIDVIAITPGTVSKYRVQWIRNAIPAA